MKFYSTNSKNEVVSFREAVLTGLAHDNGLYMPVEIPTTPAEACAQSDSLPSLADVACEVTKAFADEDLTDAVINSIVRDAIDFPAPLVEVEKDVFSLELFHGPTLAFKDFGARFMARIMASFLEGSKNKLTILVATSGDTGSAVASGFLGLPNIDVVILYPSGKVSSIQEMQLTTMGNNISALEVDGSFDQCQSLVKEAFLDPALQKKRPLSSANSINIARLIPQAFYYAHTALFFKHHNLPAPVISVPCGNFGNITAGVMASRMGFEFEHFVAATNMNSVVPEYLQTGEFKPRPSISTISNAMDVGNPSNFARLMDLFDNNHDKITEMLSGYCFSDDATRQAIKDLFIECNYLADPHGAVGYLGLRRFLSENNIAAPGVFLETAHSAKFIDVVEPLVGGTVKIPNRLAQYLTKERTSIKIKADFNELKNYLISSR